jgi:hypothetical protein
LAHAFESHLDFRGVRRFGSGGSVSFGHTEISFGRDEIVLGLLEPTLLICELLLASGSGSAVDNELPIIRTYSPLLVSDQENQRGDYRPTDHRSRHHRGLGRCRSITA